MKILIVSYESWRNTNNGGNVLSNVFRAFADAEIAQIYCSGELPQNSICRKYFQIADSMLLKREKGCFLEEKCYSDHISSQEDNIDDRIKDKIPFVFRELALLVRELLWSCSNWKTKKLEQFIENFKPDVIFAPCYSYFHISKLALYVKHIAKCPMISYISDDNYSLKKLSFSPSFWINRLITRKWIRKLFSECALIYTMTDMQKSEYECLFNRPMRVLCKAADFKIREKKCGDPIQLIYAGGLYLNRWKVLCKISEVLSNLNKQKVVAQLHIYTASKLSRSIKKKLNDDINSFLHPSVTYDLLMQKYEESDIALHVESFDVKNRLITRLSFSTKIIDCLSSGCAVLAIGPSSNAGIAYLLKNDAAFCIDRFSDFESKICQFICDKELIEYYSQNAYIVGKKNHSRINIEKMIRQDFENIISSSKF